MNLLIPRRAFGVCLLLALGILPLHAEDWYRWRGPNLDGISRESEWSADWPNGKAKIAWTQQVGVGFSSIVVRAERAYTVGHVDQQDVVSCLNTSTGQLLWGYEYQAELDDRDFEGGPTSTPTIDEDRVYVLSRAGNLFCLDAQTGDLRWKEQIAEKAQVRVPGWGFAAAPLVVGETLLLNVGESGVAVNKRDGTLLWTSADKESGYATPVIITDTEREVAIIASSRAYIGVDLKTGTKLWTERWLTSFGCNAADPIAHDGKLFLSSGYNRGAALYDLTTGQPELVWKNKEMQNQLQSSLLYQGYLYGIDGNMEYGAKLRCLDWMTGQVMWSNDELGPGGLALADGKLILLTESGELVISAATPTGFGEIARSKVLDGKCWTTPVLSGGRIFCRSIQGQVACVDVRVR